ncbi:MAG: hypothetical protein R2861_06510 [Desulfobacterales bacterium]|jgi:hypothetical protein
MRDVKKNGRGHVGDNSAGEVKPGGDLFSFFGQAVEKGHCLIRRSGHQPDVLFQQQFFEIGIYFHSAGTARAEDDDVRCGMDHVPDVAHGYKVAGVAPPFWNDPVMDNLNVMAKDVAVDMDFPE